MTVKGICLQTRAWYELCYVTVRLSQIDLQDGEWQVAVYPMPTSTKNYMHPMEGWQCCN